MSDLEETTARAVEAIQGEDFAALEEALKDRAAAIARLAGAPDASGRLIAAYKAGETALRALEAFRHRAGIESGRLEQLRGFAASQRDPSVDFCG